MSKFSKETAQAFYGEHEGKHFFDNLTNFMASDVCIGMELIADNAIKGWRSFIGPTNSEVAQKDAPNSIRG
jgi:nucleoside-diphosphate kinase